MSVLTFCLGKICNQSSREYLRKLVREEVDFHEWDARGWQRHVCSAYAECAQGEAVPELASLYDRLQKDKSQDLAWLPIAAMVKTASRQGVRYALEHMDVLLERADNSDAAYAAAALIGMGSLDTLRDVPLYEPSHWLRLSSLSSHKSDWDRSEISWFSHPSEESATKLRGTWQERRDEIRSYWESSFEREGDVGQKPKRNK